MQVVCTISNTVGEVSMYVDGIQVFSLTSADTYNGTGAASTSQIGFNDCNGVANNRYSDILVDDAQLYGDVAVYEVVNPTDGDELQWTRSSGAGTWSSHVNSNPQAGDAMYLRSTVNGDRNCFFLPNVDDIIGTGTVVCIKATMCARKEDPAFGAIKIYTRSDDDIDHDTEQQTVTESYIFRERIFETDPKDGSAWGSGAAAAAKINATQFGLVNVS